MVRVRHLLPVVVVLGLVIARVHAAGGLDHAGSEHGGVYVVEIAAGGSDQSGGAASDKTPPTATVGGADAASTSPEGGARIAHTMRLKNGTAYTCYLPDDAEPAGGRPPPEPVRGDALVDAARSAIERYLGKSCILRYEGWWIYEYCHGKYVRQYHQNELTKSVGPVHFLGWFNATKPTPRMVPGDVATQEGLVPAVQVEYREGSECDLTGRPRKVVIRYYCSLAARRAQRAKGLADPTAVASQFMVEETATCEYAVHVHVPAMCALTHPMEEGRPHDLLTCRQEGA